jgi:hypothetical protein
MDLAADQNTMFYTSQDGRIRIFRLDRTPIPASLRSAGVQLITDTTLDPSNAGLFGIINVIDDQPLYVVKILPLAMGPEGYAR